MSNIFGVAVSMLKHRYIYEEDCNDERSMRKNKDEKIYFYVRKSFFKRMGIFLLIILMIFLWPYFFSNLNIDKITYNCVSYCSSGLGILYQVPCSSIVYSNISVPPDILGDTCEYYKIGLYGLLGFGLFVIIYHAGFIILVYLYFFYRW